MDISSKQISCYAQVEHPANNNQFINYNSILQVESVFKHFRRDSSTPTCDTIRAGNGFPKNDAETNLAGEEHRQKGETHR